MKKTYFFLFFDLVHFHNYGKRFLNIRHPFANIYNTMSNWFILMIYDIDWNSLIATVFPGPQTVRPASSVSIESKKSPSLFSMKRESTLTYRWCCSYIFIINSTSHTNQGPNPKWLALRRGTSKHSIADSEEIK